MITIKNALILGQEKLSINSSSARVDTEILLAHVLKKSRTYLYTYPEKTLSHTEQKNFEQLLTQRFNGEPIAYLLQEKEFWSLNLYVSKNTLIPRPETECLVEAILARYMNEKIKILELGTGTGAISIALGQERTQWQILATDISLEALEITKQNIMRHHLPHIQCIPSDWYQNIKDTDFDIIVSNPPYLSATDPHLNIGDLRFEPLSALSSGADGLNALRIIINQAPHHLKENGLLIVEHGFDQQVSVQKLFKNANFKNIQTGYDLQGHARFCFGFK